MSFSAGIREGDEKSIRLAQALAGLAGGLGLDTVAEGIETADEADAAARPGLACTARAGSTAGPADP